MAIVEPSYSSNRIMLGEQLPLDMPLSIVLDTSERCNFKCIYCFRSGIKDETWGFAAKNEIMTMETFELALKQLADFPRKLKLVSLSGHGEPLSNPHIADMARRLRTSGVTEKIDMHTNASLLTSENVTEIANAGFTRVVVSLQGLDSADYKRVCGVDIDWERFYHHLKRLYENKNEHMLIHIKISNTVFSQGDYVEKEGSFYSLFKPIADSVFIEKAVPLWKNIQVDSSDNENKFGFDVGEVNHCPIVFYKLFIAPDGEIYPCTQLPPPMSLGNIHETTLIDAWNSPERIDFMKEHLCLTRHNHAPCVRCFIPVNTVVSQEDNIDPYKKAIWDRMTKAEMKGGT